MTTQAKYDLHLLGWQSFQQLCLSLSKEILGQTVQSFLDTKDGGRDGAFAGTWIRQNHEDMSGKFVIQCKHFSKRDSVLKISQLKGEIEKVKNLVAEGQCDCYILLTNGGLTGVTEQKIQIALKNVGVKKAVIYGSTWICEQIHTHLSLRIAMPRLYGLGDLSQIVDARAYAQARALLSYLKEDLGKVVITDSYRKASEALDQFGFVLLIGEPAAGKTTIASLLAMTALDKWKVNPIKIDTPEKIIEHWNSENPEQLFWIDDAFGTTQYEARLVQKWNHIFSQVVVMLKQGVKIVMTSRDYIYKSARSDLKTSAFPMLEEKQVVIDVHDLRPQERKLILYNHLKLGEQPKIFLTAIKPHLDFIAEHPRFMPEMARRLANPAFTKRLPITKHNLDDFVTKQSEFMQEVIRGLDSGSRSALALVYMRNDNLESPIQFQASELTAIARMASSEGQCIQAFQFLKGSFLQLVNDGDHLLWKFKHPTIGDAFNEILILNPELLEIYLAGISTEKLLDQTTCGDIGFQRAIVIPKSFFQNVMDRLDNFTNTRNFKDAFSSSWNAKWDLRNYLATRCSKDFLKSYLERHPELIAQVTKPDSSLSISREVAIAIKLQEYALFPEANRQVFIQMLSEYAAKGESLYPLESKRLRAIFTSDELKDMKKRIKTELIPHLDEVRSDLEISYGSLDAPDSHIRNFQDILNVLRDEFHESDDLREIEIQMDKVEEWLLSSIPDTVEIPKREIGDIPLDENIHTLRSVFEDIDA